MMTPSFPPSSAGTNQELEARLIEIEARLLTLEQSGGGGDLLTSGYANDSIPLPLVTAFANDIPNENVSEDTENDD